MRRLSVVALLLCCATLCGCRPSGEVENQAYVLALGVDRLADGQIGLTARVPKIGRQSAGKGESDGGGAYLTFTASGEGWASALDALERATPRQTNLSHIVMLIVSEALAGEADFASLVSAITETPHLYATARFVVCAGSAGEFTKAGETVIGTRMSSELNAMLDHYAAQGYIPACCLADAYFAFNSVYGDPVAIHAEIDPRAESPQRQRFSGAALFSRGRFVRALDARETRLMNLVRGEASAVPCDAGGLPFWLTPEGKPVKRVDADGVHLALSLSAADAPQADIQRVEAALEGEIAELIRSCQRLGAEPFGFAEAAATRFSTIGEWIGYNWGERFMEADVEVDVTIRRIE